MLVSKACLSAKVLSICKVTVSSGSLSSFISLSLSDEFYVVTVHLLPYSLFVSLILRLKLVSLSLFLPFFFSNLQLKVLLHHESLPVFFALHDLLFITASEDAAVALESLVESVVSHSASSHDSREIRFSLLRRVGTACSIGLRITLVSVVGCHIVGKGISCFRNVSTSVDDFRLLRFSGGPEVFWWGLVIVMSVRRQLASQFNLFAGSLLVPIFHLLLQLLSVLLLFELFVHVSRSRSDLGRVLGG